MIHVCSLALLNKTIETTGAQHVVTLLGAADQVPLPSNIKRGNYLRLYVHDIVDPTPGQVQPEIEHVERLVEFVQGWKRETPLVIHCWAGISRSMASAFAILCDRLGENREIEIARAMRQRAPHALARHLRQQGERAGCHHCQPRSAAMLAA